jgi:hypothetical protein
MKSISQAWARRATERDMAPDIIKKWANPMDLVQTIK